MRLLAGDTAVSIFVTQTRGWVWVGRGVGISPLGKDLSVGGKEVSC